MSNEAKTTTMTEDAKLLVTPQLRFPEFRNAAAWDKKSLGRLFTIGNGRDHKHLPPGDVPVYGSGGYMRSVDEFLHDGESVCIGRKGTINNPMFLTGRFWTVDTLFYTHSFNQCVPRFIFAIFQRIDWPKHNEAGGVPSLSKANIEKIKTAVPSLAEQQKIADCLTSVDELIAAQSRKVEALKTHKKGLMRQLFPQPERIENGVTIPAETQPHLRFPEFQKTGQWELKTLGEIVDVASGQVDPTEPPYCDMPHIGGENIESQTGNLQGVRTARELGLISGKYLFDGRDILYSKIRPTLNKVATPEFEGICSADIYPIRPSNQNLLRQYLVYLLRSDSFIEYTAKHSDRSKIPKVNRDSLLAYELVIPCRPEQQRIASFLTSLDELIAAQTQKLDTIKTHKKGLMQLLFPSQEELEA